MDMFAKIVKLGLTYKTDRGQILPQDVYKLPLTGNNGFNLDSISRELLKKVRETQQDSLVTTSKADPDDELRLEVLKFIIEDKQQELQAAKDASLRKQQREELQELIAKKQKEAKSEKSVEELQAELLALEAGK
ncbi:hypothetical protein VPHG_00060 [Vibrio phage 11895-B1]|uniref:hypothetical protein n=1 Tax=Vibrio phage 11895-B1 TaxID=754075 RepID=UPI0002C09FB0|nr:hypothetical protein VPHG_00060 [Vibrio phage 11895-B1]AGH32127.1 hypothetical protein VPHG_00060 [Vibrio phage 11895-B1]